MLWLLLFGLSDPVSSDVTGDNENIRWKASVARWTSLTIIGWRTASCVFDDSRAHEKELIFLRLEGVGTGRQYKEKSDRNRLDVIHEAASEQRLSYQ
jgi:hypothetical protein